MPAGRPVSAGRQRERSDDPLADEAMRWLDRPIVGYDDQEKKIAGLIRGIDRLPRVRAWIAVERYLGRDDGEPRAGILEALQERADELEQLGERPDRLRFGPRRPCECCEDDGPTADAIRADRERDRQRLGGYSATSSSGSDDGTETSTLGEFAGGGS